MEEPLTRLTANTTPCMFPLLHYSFFLSLYITCTQNYMMMLLVIFTLVTPGNQMTTQTKGPILNRANSLV